MQYFKTNCNEVSSCYHLLIQDSIHLAAQDIIGLQEILQDKDEVDECLKKQNNTANLCEDLVSLCIIQYYTTTCMCEKTSVCEEYSGQKREKKKWESIGKVEWVFWLSFCKKLEKIRCKCTVLFLEELKKISQGKFWVYTKIFVLNLHVSLELEPRAVDLCFATFVTNTCGFRVTCVIFVVLMNY